MANKPFTAKGKEKVTCNTQKDLDGSHTGSTAVPSLLAGREKNVPTSFLQPYSKTSLFFVSGCGPHCLKSPRGYYLVTSPRGGSLGIQEEKNPTTSGTERSLNMTWFSLGQTRPMSQSLSSNHALKTYIHVLRKET